MKISVVIPTRNRPGQLRRLLECLSKQQQVPEEVIISDSSDDFSETKVLLNDFPRINGVHVTCPASVCAQRNKGVEAASSPYIFLCDDDMELPENYLSTLAGYISRNPSAGIVSGMIKEKNPQGNWQGQYIPSLQSLYKAFIFQHTLWVDVSGIRYNLFNFLPLLFFRILRKKGNGISLAGWPRLIDFSSPVFKTPVYGLGASVIKKELLLQNPFDETLDPHGIGDNYAFIFSIPGNQAIHVLSGTEAFHHKSDANRLEKRTAYFRRVLVLHYVMRTNKKFSFLNRLMLCWSVFGNLLACAFKWDYKGVIIERKLLNIFLFGENPYEAGMKGRKKGITPEWRI